MDKLKESYEAGIITYCRYLMLIKALQVKNDKRAITCREKADFHNISIQCYFKYMNLKIEV